MSKLLKLLTLVLVLGFGIEPSTQSQPICEVACATSRCSSNADCTAAPKGHCRFACPGVGCCVYN
jgi:hypothetical protein